MKKVVFFAAVAMINLAMASCSADGFPGSIDSPTVQNDSIGGPGHTHVPPLPPPPKIPGIGRLAGKN